MKNVLFSIFMCARNAESTIKKAINSVLKQNCTDWELIIVDNASTDRTWMIIEEEMEHDSRIKGIHLEQGIGWAKGASICLEQAKGDYMTFLAADDFLVGNGSLDAVEECIREEEPGIVWIGHVNVELGDNGYSICGGIIPKYKIYDGTDKINEIYEIMGSLYYNAFFHFISIELLKNNGINFFEPFYADYEGVTEAMCRTAKSVVLDQAVYALTVNTSQTSGGVIWKDCTAQWNSIKRIICEKGCYDCGKLGYIAIRIMSNNAAILKGICNKPIRDKEMNLINKTPLERLQYVETVLETPEFDEMFYYAGREYFLDGIFEGIKDLCEQCIREGYAIEKIMQNVRWLDKLVWGLYECNGERLVERTEFSIESMENLKQALCNEYNTGVFGYELVGRKLSYLTSELHGIWNEINKAYVSSILKRIYELLYTAEEIKRNGRVREVIVIVKECMGIIEQIKTYVSEKDLVQVANDLKMVVDVL